ncbi:MAG: PIN domain-containing protein, partial [Bacteroidales bacterium]
MKSTKESKIFVLDTNVILHDFRSIHNFQENDIVIPIAVIEELDKFKKGNEQINYNARQFIREMDKITDNRLFDGGITIGKGKGKIKIEIGHPFTEKMSHSLFIDNQDHRILSTTLWLTEQNPNRQVVLVTKDINLRMKAKALQLFTEDYLSDKVSQERIESISRGVKKVKIADESLLQKLYYQEGGVPIAQLG